MRPQHMPQFVTCVPVILVPCLVPVLVRVGHGHMMTRKTRCSISTIATSGNGVTAVFANSSP
jgi:hypothetical protein